MGRAWSGRALRLQWTEGGGPAADRREGRFSPGEEAASHQKHIGPNQGPLHKWTPGSRRHGERRGGAAACGRRDAFRRLEPCVPGVTPPAELGAAVILAAAAGWHGAEGKSCTNAFPGLRSHTERAAAQLRSPPVSEPGHHGHGHERGHEQHLTPTHDFRKLAGLTAPGTPFGGWEAPNVQLRGHFHISGTYFSAFERQWESLNEETGGMNDVLYQLYHDNE
uniref:Uncharacterized protein n=1 Tax=Setaria italica TaxID=4555 RepID=K3XLR9_SETIT